MYKILIWGTGEVANKVLDNCKTINEYEIIGCIDNNIKKIGTYFRKYKVYSIEILDSVVFDKIVILTEAYEEIYSQIVDKYPTLIGKIENKNFFFKESLLCRYKGTKDEEIIKVLTNIKENGLNVFNYSFVEKYTNYKVPVYFDKKCSMNYVIHKGKFLYFPKKYDNEEKVLKYYRSILAEQDRESPHRYLSDDFNVLKGSIVVDVGVAEGNFALEIIDKVSKIYLIEADDDWIEALEETFKNYRDKVVIKRAFVSSYDEGKFSKLDSMIKEPVDFIKMDIEGNEWDALLGAEEIVRKSENLQLAVCCYHSDFDQILIEKYMDQHKITHDTTRGYMWFPYTVRQNYVSTSLNRAVVRGRKCEMQ